MLDLHDKVRYRSAPDLPVAREYCWACPPDLEGMVDIGCVGGIKFDPRRRRRAAPGGGPAQGDGFKLLRRC